MSPETKAHVGAVEHLTEDYALTADGRLLLRADALAQWRARGPGMHMTPTRICVRIYGDAAVAPGRGR